MGETVRAISAPTVKLTGTRVLDSGTTQSFDSSVDNAAIPQGSPTSVDNPTLYMFQDKVVITLTDSYTNVSYSKTESNKTKVGIRFEDNKSNIIYFFGYKLPVVTESEVYTSTFTLAKPGVSFTGKGYVLESDEIVLNAVSVFSKDSAYGSLATIKIKIV